MEVQRTDLIFARKTKELVEMLESSTAIYNQSLYFLRQAYFSTKELGKIKTPNYVELYNLVKETESFKNSKLDYVVKQAVIKQVISNWKGFIRATVEYWKNPSKFKGKPKLPRYFKQDKLNLLIVDSSRLRKKNCKENELRLPCSNYKIKTRFTKDQIDCVRILSFYGKIKIEVIYKKSVKSFPVDYTNAVGLDIGVNNLATITSNNQKLSWIINGRPVKSMNQYYNKQFAYFQSKLSKDQHTSKRIQALNLKRRNKLDHYLH